MESVTKPVEQCPAEVRQLYELACAVRERAYAPYSGYLVGAAVKTARGAVFPGCNMENASYGATICAERVAIGSAVAAESKPVVTAVMVVTDAETPWPPCGMCRQVIAEFAQDCVLYTANLAGDVTETPFTELFPSAFVPEHLVRVPPEVAVANESGSHFDRSDEGA